MYVRYTVLMAPKGNLYRVNKQLKHVGVKSFLNFHETSLTHTHTVRWLFAETTPGDFKKSVTRISPVTNNTEAMAGIWPSPAQHTHTHAAGRVKETPPESLVLPLSLSQVFLSFPLFNGPLCRGPWDINMTMCPSGGILCLLSALALKRQRLRPTERRG